jgi:hypothetical protein
MFGYLKYLLSPVLVSAHMWGMWHGGAWTWLGLGVLLAVMALDMCLPVDLTLPDQRFPWVYDVVVTVTLLSGFAQLFVFSYLVGAGRLEDTLSFAGAFVGTASYGFVVAGPPVHELFHRDTAFLRGLGRIGLCLIFDPWREITHVASHHLKVATPDDPDTARRGEGLYRFFVRSFSGQARDAVRLERAMWTKRGRTWWHPLNRWVRWTAGLAIFAAALHAVGGTAGMLWTIASALLGPRLFLEVFNYVNHYGLVTEHPGRFARRHTWNHLTPFVRILTLEITNHAGHHEDPYRPFYRLEPDATGPRQPQFLLCVLAALVPPLWFAIIRPRLHDWDTRYATPRERALAREANRAAGWEDSDSDAVTPMKRLAA